MACLHAPTGSGKTFALWGGIIQEALKIKKTSRGHSSPMDYSFKRALAVEIQQATQRITNELN